MNGVHEARPAWDAGQGKLCSSGRRPGACAEGRHAQGDRAARQCRERGTAHEIRKESNCAAFSM